MKMDPSFYFCRPLNPISIQLHGLIEFPPPVVAGAAAAAAAAVFELRLRLDWIEFVPILYKSMVWNILGWSFPMDLIDSGFIWMVETALPIGGAPWRARWRHFLSIRIVSSGVIITTLIQEHGTENSIKHDWLNSIQFKWYPSADFDPGKMNCGLAVFCLWRWITWSIQNWLLRGFFFYKSMIWKITKNIFMERKLNLNWNELAKMASAKRRAATGNRCVGSFETTRLIELK